MTAAGTFERELETSVIRQLGSQRVGYLLGAGSSYLNGNGYPLAFQLWELIKDRIPDSIRRAEIQAKLDSGANGLEHALDLLDDGGASDPPHRHLVTAAVAEVLMPKEPPVDLHCEFLRRLSHRSEPGLKIFSLNYDPLIERAAARARIRLVDGFLGAEHSYFEPAVFDERIGTIRGSFRAKQFGETVKPIHLLKLHGSLGWYECGNHGVRRCRFADCPPSATKRLMIPPQRRKAVETMYVPYSPLWSRFRGCLSQDATLLNRLVCVGYGFCDEHVNDVIDAALARQDFTLLILAKALADSVWSRWSSKPNVYVVTESRSSIKGRVGPGHPDLWSFERLATEA